MASTTTRGYRYPDAGDTPDIPTAISNLASDMNSKTGLVYLGSRDFWTTPPVSSGAQSSSTGQLGAVTYNFTDVFNANYADYVIVSRIHLYSWNSTLYPSGYTTENNHRATFKFLTSTGTAYSTGVYKNYTLKIQGDASPSTPVLTSINDSTTATSLTWQGANVYHLTNVTTTNAQKLIYANPNAYTANDGTGRLVAGSGMYVTCQGVATTSQFYGFQIVTLNATGTTQSGHFDIYGYAQ